MTKIQNSKLYGIEERMFKFADTDKLFIKTVTQTDANREDERQLLKTPVNGSLFQRFGH